MHRTAAVAAATLVLASGAGAATVDVFVFNFDFSVNMPGQAVEDAVINVGDTVRWVWLTGIHSTTSVAGSSETWNSFLLLPPDTFEHTFMTPGVFAYYCSIHATDNGDGTFSGMGGYVTVLVPAPGGAALAGAVGLAGLRRRRR